MANVTATPNTPKKKMLRCKDCGFPWFARKKSAGNGYIEPEQCPSPQCRSRHWKQGSKKRRKTSREQVRPTDRERVVA